MKNILMIDVDSERKENQIIINKPQSFIMPENEEGKKQMIVDDLKSLTHALGSLILIAGGKGYGNPNELLDEVKLLLNDYYPKSE